MLSALLVFLVAVAGQGNEEAVAREWWVRAVARALVAEETGAELPLVEALASPVWRRRATALDVVARVAETGAPLAPSLVDAARAALRDPHPGVRARALAVLGAVGAPLSAAEAARLLEEPLPLVRLELARGLEFMPAPARAAHLARLGLDPDERVREAARNALAGLEADEAGVAEARRTLFVASATNEELPALARFLLQLAEGPLEEAWIPPARAAVAPLGSVPIGAVPIGAVPIGAVPLGAARRAALEALAFARFGAGDAGLLARGASDEAMWESPCARLVRRAAESRSRPLADALSGVLGGVGTDGSAPGVPALGPLARAGLLGLLVDTLEPHTLDYLAAELNEAPELLAEIFGELGYRRDVWDEHASAPFAAESSPRPVREALLAAVAGAVTRVADPGGEGLLLRFLGDPEPDLAARAFEVLAGARARSARAERALYAAFATLAPEEQLARLARFSRESPCPSFRADWIALGQRVPPARPALCELLAGFTGEEETRAALAAWLAEDLARSAGDEPIARELEQRVQAELRALARVSDGAALTEFRMALERALGRSTEIGKIAAAALGRSAAGRAQLLALLDAGALASEDDRRTRIEACLALARAGTDDERASAVALLIQDRPRTAWDLRERMLRALAAAEREEAWAELERLAFAPELEPVERSALAALLGAGGDERARRSLRGLARGPFDLESRRVALDALAALADGSGLHELYEAFLRGELPGGESERALLLGELLVALADLVPPSPEVCAAWLRAPLAAARENLEQRFAGNELAATEFAWRQELEIARALARSHALGGCLAATPAWERLDGRMLLALGEVVEDEGDRVGANTLLAAAMVALAGERDPDRSLLAWAGARRLRLAWRESRRATTAGLAARTLAARRDGALSDEQWARLFGGPDHARPEDPDARVRALLLRARAWVALERGDLAAARALARRAAEARDDSASARGDQAALERALAGPR